MHKEMPGAIIVFGEIGLVGVTKEHLLSQPDHLNDISRISSHAGGIEAMLHPEHKVVYVGCNPLGVGEEAEDMKAVTETYYPDTRGRILTFNGLMDTSYQAEAIADYIKNSEVNPNDVNVILPIEHTVRTWTKLRSRGVKPKIKMAHVIYTSDQNVDAAERNRRRDEVWEAYANLNMYLDMSKETIASLFGILDPQGLLTRRVTRIFRGS